MHVNIDLEEHSLHNMSGGACLFIDLETDMSLGINKTLESPKHRVSLELHMNSYVHRSHYSQPHSTPLGCHMRKAYVETI